MESLRVRCPHCLKLFLVQTREIRETKPRFECANCHELFWMSYPDCISQDEVLGMRLDQWEPLTKSRPEIEEIAAMTVAEPEPDPGCPKCHRPLNPGMVDCPHCGVIPQKYLLLKTASRIQGSDRLGALWKKIIDDYDNDDLHQELLKASSIENNLAFAGGQYAQLLKVIPNDPRASRMVREIEAMVSVPISHVKAMRAQQNRVPTPRWVHVLLAVGGMLVAVGVFVPLLRNLTGAGAVLIFIAVCFILRLFRL
jgi:hypothetical protein